MGGRYGDTDDGSASTADRRPPIELRRDAHQIVQDTFEEVEQDRERRNLATDLENASDAIAFVLDDEAASSATVESAADEGSSDAVDSSTVGGAIGGSVGSGTGGLSGSQSSSEAGERATTRESSSSQSFKAAVDERAGEAEEGDSPRAWHEAFNSRAGMSGMFGKLPSSDTDADTDTDTSGSTTETDALGDSYNQLFDRMGEMSAAASEAAQAQSDALRQSQQEREAARPYDNDDIQHDKSGLSGPDRARRNAEEQRVRRGTDVAGPHSVPWNEQEVDQPENKTLSQQESIEADAAELNRISEEAHNGIDHGERAEAVRTTSPTQTAPTDDVLNPESTTQDIDEPAYSPDATDIASDSETIPENWEATLTDNHGAEVAEQVDELATQITDAFPESVTESDVTPDQFTTGPEKSTVATRIADLVDNSGCGPEEAAFTVADELNGDSRTRHAFDSSQVDSYEMLSDSRQAQATTAAENLQDTYPTFDQQDLEEVEHQVAREMADGTDALSAAANAVTQAAENDTFIWPIEQLDVNRQHRVTVEGNVTTLYDPNDEGQHQVGIIESPDADFRTVENHMKFTWHKNSGKTGKVTDLSGDASATGGHHTPTVDDSVISDSRTMIREGDRVRFIRGTVDEWEEAAKSGEDGQKQLAVRGVTKIQIIEAGDGPVIYEEMDRPIRTSTSQDRDAALSSQDRPEADDFDDVESYWDEVEPDAEERRPAAADSVTAARDVVSTDDAPDGLGAREGVERVERDGDSYYEITTEEQGTTPSNPWRADDRREREQAAQEQQRYDDSSEEYRRSQLRQWDVPDDAIDDIIEEEREERIEEEVAQSMSHQRSKSETFYGYDSEQVHLDLPTGSERREPR
jgi:hypothetical protein